MIYKILIIIFIITVSILYSRNKEQGKIRISEKAPLFSAINHNNKKIQLEDYKGKYVVLYFFPKAFTPGWTKQACGFRDQYSIYKDNNIVVIGVSYDSPIKLNKFKEKYNLPFTLISDKDKIITSLYNSGGLFFPSRKTIIINPVGNIVDIIENINISTHSDDIIKIILDDNKLNEKLIIDWKKNSIL